MRTIVPAALLLAASLVAAQSDSGVAAKITALEKAWNQAYKAADRRALDAILDNHIVLTNDDGSAQTKAEFLESLTPSNSQEQQVTSESITVHVFGDVAIATGVFQAKGVEKGKRYSATVSWIPGCAKEKTGSVSELMRPRFFTEEVARCGKTV
jgi:ketosteroid isomerase-like protein